MEVKVTDIILCSVTASEVGAERVNSCFIQLEGGSRCYVEVVGGGQAIWLQIISPYASQPHEFHPAS